MLWWLFECLQEVQHVPDINMDFWFGWRLVVIFRQISPLPGYCDPDYVLAMFQDLNNVVCLVWISLGLQGFSSLHVFLWLLDLVWYFTII